MTDPIEKVAERVLANKWRTHAERICVTSSSAPALAREVLALRKLCAAMREALAIVAIDVECYCQDSPENRGKSPCARCQADAALLAARPFTKETR